MTILDVSYGVDVNPGAATASAVVTAAADGTVAIPTLSPLGLAPLMALTALVGARLRRR